MLFKGTPTLKKGDIGNLVETHGGSWNGFTWVDFTAYFETLPSQHLDLAIRIESDRLANALFDPDEVESERTVIISEREGAENQPFFHLHEETTAAAFKVHPYGQPVVGWKSDLHRITREDLYDYYRTYYTPNNGIAVAVGDFDTADLLKRVEDAFGPHSGRPLATASALGRAAPGRRAPRHGTPAGTGAVHAGALPHSRPGPSRRHSPPGRRQRARGRAQAPGSTKLL